jgi:hypothetical protein
VPDPQAVARVAKGKNISIEVRAGDYRLLFFPVYAGG